MSSQVNRAILLCENWQDKQAMLENVFGKGISADLSKQKYEKTTAKQKTAAGSIPVN